MREAACSMWAEPRAPNPPGRTWADWAIVAVALPAAVIETILRPDLAWRAASLVLIVVLLPTVLWRRTHPLAMVSLVFGCVSLFTVASIVAGAGAEGLDTGIFVLLLPYALFRWGSGR